jgi:hypothetical protein
MAWLVTIAHLPTEDPAARMRVLRTLEALGAALMHEGAYLLPDTASNRQALQALAEYVARIAGHAHILQALAISDPEQQALERLFDRSARYEALIKTVESLRVGFGQADPGAISRVLGKQRREFEAIAALDFFPTEVRGRAERALAEADEAVRQLLYAAQSGTLVAGESMLRRVWATRRPPWADRLACAWLIRRFVDPEAQLVWLDKGQEPPEGALGFAFEGAHFAAGGPRVAYEEMLARLDLAKNPALTKIGAIVHYLEAGGDAVPESAGVQMLLQGAMRRSPREEDLLGEVEKTFDLLYEAYYEPAKR